MFDWYPIACLNDQMISIISNFAVFRDVTICEQATWLSKRKNLWKILMISKYGYHMVVVEFKATS